MTKYEKISSILGVLGFFVGVFALAVSVWGHIRTSELHEERLAFDQEQRKSKVVIQIGRDINQDKLVFEPYKGQSEYGAIFKQRYNLIINNIGLQPASINDWRIVGKSQIVSPDTGKNMYGWYDGMGPLFYTKDGTQVSAPLTIEPNKPQKLVIEVGVRVPLFAWKSVANNITLDKEYDYYKAENIFSERGYPQFGQYQLNHVSGHGELTAMAYGPGLYQQDFILYLTKGDGSQVSAKFSPNISDFFIQGENSGTSWEEISAQ